MASALTLFAVVKLAGECYLEHNLGANPSCKSPAAELHLMQLSHARTRSHFACSTDGTPWSHLSPLPAEEVFSAQFLAQFFAHKVVEAMLWRKGMQATLLCAITLLSGAFRRPDPGRQCATCLLAPMRLHWTAARMHTSPSVGRSHMNALLTHIHPYMHAW